MKTRMKREATTAEMMGREHRKLEKTPHKTPGSVSKSVRFVVYSISAGLS
jgi:hypothetical protein